MLKDKSRVLFLGALVLLIVALSNGGIQLHGFHFFHGFSWLSWLLFGLFIWLIVTRTGCCGGGDHDDGDDLTDEDLDVEEDDAKE